MRGLSRTDMFTAIGFSVLMMASGSSVFAADAKDDQIKINRMLDAASVEYQATSAARTAALAKEDEKYSREPNRNLERPISVPDSSDQEMMADRNPGCGSGESPIRHMHCDSGYDVY